MAKEISRLEVGQTVVVKDGTVLAVEGFEGTDRCL
ncbi:MAG: UDP-2,3-diacylglucosamine diphosphatase LpxI, partial [Verrucomicrobiota bacterium]